MQKFELLLEPNSKELPDCRCGAQMSLAHVNNAEGSLGAELRTYRCDTCGHEFKLTVWADVAASGAGVAGL